MQETKISELYEEIDGLKQRLKAEVETVCKIKVAAPSLRDRSVAERKLAVSLKRWAEYQAVLFKDLKMLASRDQENSAFCKLVKENGAAFSCQLHELGKLIWTLKLH